MNLLIMSNNLEIKTKEMSFLGLNIYTTRHVFSICHINLGLDRTKIQINLVFPLT